MEGDFSTEWPCPEVCDTIAITTDWEPITKCNYCMTGKQDTDNKQECGKYYIDPSTHWVGICKFSISDTSRENIFLEEELKKLSSICGSCLRIFEDETLWKYCALHSRYDLYVYHKERVYVSKAKSACK